eukprot:TRINITY_DN1179_c0_g1_i4.p1 TRINITY_DN1179_c0_g1~~TRINITY_DN1179_c0_g1_i4.p1  ORF type:complete len:1256 (+),score=370.76 TRINITY_DN1179_c0_g1_i4:37-3804(+)
MISRMTGPSPMGWGLRCLVLLSVAVGKSCANTAGVTVNPTVITTTEVGGTAQFTVVLNTQPAQSVSIAVSSSSAEGSVTAGAALTFLPGNWNVAQTVTVTGNQDAVDDGDVAYTIETGLVVSTDPVYSGMVVANVAATNIDDDTSGVTMTPLAGLVTAEPAGAAVFTVVLDTQPAAAVAINFVSSDATEGSVNPAGVTFLPADYSVAQTVTLTAVDDSVADGTVAYSVSATIATADATYTGMVLPVITAQTTDDDTAGIDITAAAMLTTTEAGATASYTVKLRSQPTATVTIPVASSDTSEGSVSPSTLVFTTLDWNAAKTVVITGVNDDVDDGDVAFTVITGAATSPDAVYHGMSGVAVGVTNTDDDTVGFTVSATALATSEGGVAAVFTVVLNTQPTATVTLPLASSDATEGTASTLSLTFTSANWNQPQTVTITGVDDNLDDGDQAYNVVFAAALSGDPLYQGQKPADIPAVNSDNDVAGVTVTPTTGLQTSEAGASATFTVQLNTAPTAPVTFPVVSLTPTEGTVDKATLSFDTATWATPQTVTVTGVQDLVQDGPVPYTVALQAATSTDAKYNTFDPADVALINNDDDAAGVTITPTSMLVTTEAGGTAQFTVVLNSMPTQTVTIGLTSSNPAEGTVPPTVTFTTTDWMTAQAITVTGVPDDVDDGDVSFTVITANTASADPNYNAIDVPDVSATNTDDDTAAVIFNPTAGLTTTEAGGTATFAVRLASKPVQPVTLTLASSNTGEGIPTPASLTFTDMTWNADQMVIVTGQNDAVVDGTIAYTISTTVTTTDTAYAAVVVPTVSAANTDDDAAGITVTSAAVLALTEGGGSATYTIQLTSQPTADVTVPVQSSDTTEGTASPLSIAFTTLNWNVPQTVTVVGVNDAVDDGDVAFFLSNGPAASTDPNYQGRQGTSVQASTADDDDTPTPVPPTSSPAPERPCIQPTFAQPCDTASIECTLQIRHFSAVRAVAFSPDGTQLASGSVDKTARIFDATTGLLVTHLSCVDFAAYDIAYSRDGSKIAVGGAGGRLVVCDAASGTTLFDLLNTGGVPVTRVSFSPDGSLLVSAGGEAVTRSFDLQDSGSSSVIATGYARSARFSADGTRIATIGASIADSVVEYLASNSTSKPLPSPVGDVVALDYSPSGGDLLRGYLDGKTLLWSFGEQRDRLSLSLPSGVLFDSRFTPDGTKVAATGLSEVALWSAADGRKLGSLVGHTLSVYRVAFRGDSKKAATAGQDGKILIWDVSSFA